MTPIKYSTLFIHTILQIIKWAREKLSSLTGQLFSCPLISPLANASGLRIVCLPYKKQHTKSAVSSPDNTKMLSNKAI
jgi:hypothetical protein